MRVFVALLIMLFFTIIIYLTLGFTLDMVTGNLLPVVNQSGGNYTTISGIYNNIDTAFTLIIVAQIIAIPAAYLIESHVKEYEEYEYRDRRF